MNKLSWESNVHLFNVKELIHRGCLPLFFLSKAVGLKVIVSLMYSSCCADSTKALSENVVHAATKPIFYIFLLYFFLLI